MLFESAQQPPKTLAKVSPAFSNRHNYRPVFMAMMYDSKADWAPSLLDLYTVVWEAEFCLWFYLAIGKTSCASSLDQLLVLLRAVPGPCLRLIWVATWLMAWWHIPWETAHLLSYFKAALAGNKFHPRSGTGVVGSLFDLVCEREDKELLPRGKRK